MTAMPYRRRETERERGKERERVVRGVKNEVND